MSGAGATPSADVLLAPATVPNHNDRVFCIGPFGDKVGFGSQQRRALNLVWALKTKERLISNPHVAVIGGGLSGLMACAGLRGSGCSVELFEAGPSVLHRQRLAIHRTVHPMINAWPMLGPLRSTTAHPFMDWYVGKCDRIITRLSTEWETFGGTVVSEQHLNHRVLDVKGTKDHVEVTYTNETISPDPNGENAQIKHFDLCVVATGFGEEDLLSLSHGSSYWVKGSIAQVRDDEPEVRDIAVSGTGDGGVIDCLRLAHMNFEGGQLQLRLIADLRLPAHGPEGPRINRFSEEEFSEKNMSQWEKAIADAEKEARRLRKIDFTGSPTEIRKAIAENNDEIAELLQRRYLEIVDTLDGDVKKYLKRSLTDYKRITLYGLQSAPFSLESSPVNKLMLAHLISEHKELYKQAEITEQTSGGKVQLKIRKIRPGARKQDFNPTFYVCRHGANPPIQELIKDFDVAAFRLKQRDIADVLRLYDFELEEFTEQLRECREPDDLAREYVQDRQRLIDDYCIDYYGARPRMIFGNGESPSKIEVIKSDQYKDSKKRTGGWDDQLFGLEVMTVDDYPSAQSAARMVEQP